MTAMAEALKDQSDSLYERDFHAWTQDQAAKLRARASFDNRGDIDWLNAAEEIESLGRSDRREIASRLNILLTHLLKWTCQPDHRSNSWLGSIREQRHRIHGLLAESPSLRNLPAQCLPAEYPSARLKASGETGLPESDFPSECPFSIEQVLDPDYLSQQP